MCFDRCLAGYKVLLSALNLDTRVMYLDWFKSPGGVSKSNKYTKQDEAVAYKAIAVLSCQDRYLDLAFHGLVHNMGWLRTQQNFGRRDAD